MRNTAPLPTPAILRPALEDQPVDMTKALAVIRLAASVGKDVAAHLSPAACPLSPAIAAALRDQPLSLWISRPRGMCL